MENNIEKYVWLRDLAANCDEFVLAIPDDYIVARLYGDSVAYSSAISLDYWKGSCWFTDVIVLKANQLDYQWLHKKIRFDVCFYGEEYGKKWQSDEQYMIDNNVSFVSLAANNYADNGQTLSLNLPLNNLPRNHIRVIFGTGQYCHAYMKNYGDKYPISYAVDNNKYNWGRSLENMLIQSPEYLLKDNTERILVLICCKNYKEIVEQISVKDNIDYRTLLKCEELAVLDEFAIVYADEECYLKKTHTILTSILKEFDRVCVSNNIKYYMICGSLIGAVRHYGHIPWDDDIDVAVPREDYEKLKKIAVTEWNGTDYKFIDYKEIGGEAFLDCMPRLFFVGDKIPTKCCNKVAGKATADIVDRAFIDIYVMDNAHSIDIAHSLITILMKVIYNFMMGHRAYINYVEYEKLLPPIGIAALKVVHKIGEKIPLLFLENCYDKLAMSAKNDKKSKNFIMDSCAIRCIERKYPKKYFGQGKRQEFDGIEVMIPSDVDGVLTSMGYGNYMDYPRLSLRKPSHYFNSDIEIS